jgi:hypothetical protein
MPALGSAHEKALILDRRGTIMGSYNFSAGAAWNSEDLDVVTWPEVAEAYAPHWQARQAGAVRFADASEWWQRWAEPSPMALENVRSDDLPPAGDEADLLETPVLPISISDPPIARVGAGESRDLAPAVVIEPFDAPISGVLAILENLGRLWRWRPAIARFQ